MDLKQLKYFVHVAELGSFTKASAVLSVAQSALSHQVRGIELELKQQLLHRDGRGVRPTDAGARLLSHARGIIAQFDRAMVDLADARGAPVGHIVVGLPVSLARLLTVTLIEALHGAFPNATFGIMEGLSSSVTEWMVTGRIDIGVVYNAIPSPQIEIRPLCDQDLLLVARRRGARLGASTPTTQLAEFPLILPRRPNANRTLIDGHFARVGLKPRIAFEIDGIPSILDLVHEGYGFAILPRTSLRAHVHAGDFIASPIVEPRLKARLSLITSAQRPATPLSGQALELVRELAINELADEARQPG